MRFNKILSFLLGFSFFIPTFASAACSPFFVASGGTGFCSIVAGSVLFGNGTSPIATSSVFTYNSVLNRLTVTNASTTALTITGLATAAGAFLAVDPTGAVIATSTPGASSGTVTNIATTFPIQGGPITTTGTITFGGLGTTSPFTVGGLAMVSASNRITSVGTSTPTVTSPITYSGTLGNFVGGVSGAFACATCNTSNATVSSITGGLGLNGGVITTSGTLSLKTYLGTSTADTANQISVFTSTNATPATFGGFANFTFNSTTNTFVVINATTTNLSASQSLFIASKQVNPYQNATFAYGATSTAWTGTTTEIRLVAPFSGTIADAQCTVPTGTLNVQVKVNSTNVTPMISGASSTVGTVGFTASNTFVRGDVLEFDFGTPASSPTNVSCTARTTVTTF